MVQETITYKDIILPSVKRIKNSDITTTNTTIITISTITITPWGV